MRRLLPAALLLLGAAASVAGPARAQDEEFTLNVNVELVELRVAVLDAEGRFVSGLEAEDFEVLENRVPQRISLFRREDLPVSLGLVLDNSRSMTLKKDRLDTAAASFLRESNPDDEAFLMHFDDRARLTQDFGFDIAGLEARLAQQSPYGQTAMFDALVMGLEHMEQARFEQKAILLVTDGVDNASRRSFDQVIESVRASDVAVYPVGLLADTEAGVQARAELERIAQISGGRAFFPADPVEIPAITLRIARELREMYTIGYVPTNPAQDGTWRSIRVQLTAPESPDYELSYRHGYYAPGGTAGGG